MAANNLDLARLRDQTMGSGADEEAVTVNTRALIDKVLARYSGDWTTLRELIQNAADALATKVVIRFETLPSRTVPVPANSDKSTTLRHVLTNHTIARLVVSNNGQPFGSDDWSRLKRIAEGNPDETKIGAFGVGFYSVFADCETPFVISGRETMAFYWKGNSLFTRAGRLPEDHPGSDTCFMLDYRSTTSPIPNLQSICQFLCTSLTFVGLESVELWLDDFQILNLSKKSAPGEDVTMPSDIKTKTKEGLMKVVGVIHQSTQIDATWMNIVGWSPSKAAASSSSSSVTEEPIMAVPSLKSFFSRLTSGGQSSINNAAAKKAAKEAEAAAQKAIADDLVGVSRATVFLRISTVNIQTYPTKNFAQELERATKKPPPKHTRIAILTSSHEESSASLSTMSGAASKVGMEIFSSVLPSKIGRVFIGFPTAQTTGLLCHISAPSVIPTVERESIDLNARYVRTWNIEMLRVAGVACRIAYAGEMSELKRRLERALASKGSTKLTDAEIDSVLPNAIHVSRQYTARESTPSAQVNEIIMEAFWNCTERASIDVLSTKGVLPSHLVRVVSQDLSFLGDTPIIPKGLTSGAEDFVWKLYDLGLVSDMTVQDIKKELDSRSLDESQLIEFLKWAGNEIGSGQLDRTTVQGFLETAVATIDSEGTTSSKTAGQGRVLVLADIKTFLNASKIPADILIPPTTIPFRFTKNIPRLQLESFGWEELQIVPWLRFLIETAAAPSQPQGSTITTSSSFAGQMLQVVSKQWDSLSQSSRSTVVELLSRQPVIPTKLGLRKPPEAYFASVKLFDDLPTYAGPSGVKEKFLTALGVRKTIELTVVFDRLMARSATNGAMAEGQWSFSDLVRYLVSVRDDIPRQDLDRLRSTAICPAEVGQGYQIDTNRTYKISDLYEPKDSLKGLPLPILKWPGVYRPGSPEAKFLSSLGLKPYPSVPELVKIMQQAASNNNSKLYMTALNYFTDNHHVNGYQKFDTSNVRATAFLLVEGYSFPQLFAPSACFTNERAAIVGYNILQLSLRPHALKFGVLADPPIQDCANRLINNPPKTHREAVDVFSYLAGRLTEINGKITDVLGSATIVPVTKRGVVSKARLISPQMCFLGSPQAYGDILDFVDFGPDANSFLLKVGSKHEPSSIELARIILSNPGKILSLLEEQKYLDLLRKLAENQANLKADKDLWKELRTSRFLMAYKVDSRMPGKSVKALEKFDPDEFNDEDEAIPSLHMLARATDIVVQDTIVEYMNFKDSVLTAPQETVLEDFYQSLGVPLLSSLVDRDVRIGSVLRDQSGAQLLRKLVLERTRLFLHDYSQDMIQHDSKWLEQNLTVKLTQSVTLHTSLRGYNVSFSEKRTAAMAKEARKSFALYVTNQYDLYDVSKQLCPLLLRRSRHNDVIALETILREDLRRLRIRGYNVNRILRQQEYQTRLAEDERRRQLAEEEKRATEKPRSEKILSSSQQNGGPVTNDKQRLASEQLPDTPESFGPDSPERPMPGGWDTPEKPKRRTATNLITNMTKQLGWGDRSGTGAPGQGPQGVSSEKDIHRNLVSAIQSCRSHNSSSVFSSPSTQNIEEARGSYCDTTPSQDISFAADSAAGIKVYLANHMMENKADFLARNMPGINTFGFILLDLGSIFGIPPQSLHIYYDDRGPTIAFNQQGALFCNYHYFAQLHLPKFETSREKKIDTVSYWWVVLCHELAHNIVREHSAQHSFYAESFAQQYFSKVMSKALQY